MLPTSPLHHLLATRLEDDPTPDFDQLVMTSGNRRNEPICIDDAEAAERLRGLADLVLTHDRDVLLRCDDSVAVIRRGQPQLWRRSRGYAAAPLVLRQPVRRHVLAVGADLKNSLAFAHDATLVAMPHTGDLDTPEARSDYDATLARLPDFLRKAPHAVAVDLHPEMYATRAGRAFAAARGVPVVAVQHHHAHAAACLAENGVDAGLALVFDGTGYGSDGTIWGAELLQVEASGCQRLATFAAVPLPGADTAIREPARQAVARLAAAGLTPEAIGRRLPALDRDRVEVWCAQARDPQLAPRSHACGRLFDSVAVLLGVAPQHITYEGQPAIRLEVLARRAADAAEDRLPFEARERDGLLEIDWAPAVLRLADVPLADAADTAAWAHAFHRAVVRAALAMVDYGASRTGARRVALSGGVFMNRLLDTWVAESLAQRGFEVLTHRALPPNDGGVAAGQAVVAGWQED
jgi:hydrogenase maturation protein HypF